MGDLASGRFGALVLEYYPTQIFPAFPYRPTTSQLDPLGRPRIWTNLRQEEGSR
jgi:hypothetical protein